MGILGDGLKSMGLGSGKGKLGKGFDELLTEKSVFEPPVEVASNSVPVSQIVPNTSQPRTEFDPVALGELKNSIKESGLIQPLIVRKKEAGYELVAGERRFRAIKDLGWAEVPVVVKDVSDEEMLALALIENIQREELNPIDTARAYRKLLDQFGMRQEDLARRVGKERTSVSNFLRLLNLPEEIQASVAAGEVSFGHARALVAIADPESQRKLWMQTKKDALSVRALEKIIKRPVRDSRITKKQASANTTAIEDELKMKFGTKVYIRKGRSKSKVVIEFYSNDDFVRILEVLQLR